MNPRKVKASLRALFNPHPTDLAAREWRRSVTRHAAPSDTPMVVFCAPLMGRAMAKDWGAISGGVARMIASLLAQSDPHWLLLLTSQDQPDGLPDDPRIRFQPFLEPVAGMDKTPKVQALMRALPDVLSGADGYMHALDADDIMHPDLVAHIRRDNNGRGYWHKFGGMIDAQSGTLARCGPRSFRYPLSKPFLKHCGSSAAIYVDFRGSDHYAKLAVAFYSAGHRNFLSTARAHGITLDPIPFPSALYVMNTGENMRDKRGLMHNKLTYLEQNTLPKSDQNALRSAFGWPL